MVQIYEGEILRLCLVRYKGTERKMPLLTVETYSVVSTNILGLNRKSAGDHDYES